MTRHLVVGDIHGCFDSLKALVDFVEVREDDVIITLGDYVDRGPKSKEVIDWLIETSQTHNLIPLRGNHDIMMHNANLTQVCEKSWYSCGGDKTLNSYAPIKGKRGDISDIPDHHWKFIAENLIPYYEMETHFFVHANVDPVAALDEQSEVMLYWEKYNDPPRHISGKIMVCGHTAQSSGVPKTNGNAICLDTKVYQTGWLTCLHVESGFIWQANESGETRTLNLDEL